MGPQARGSSCRRAHSSVGGRPAAARPSQMRAWGWRGAGHPAGLGWQEQRLDDRLHVVRCEYVCKGSHGAGSSHSSQRREPRVLRSSGGGRWPAPRPQWPGHQRATASQITEAVGPITVGLETGRGLHPRDPSVTGEPSGAATTVSGAHGGQGLARRPHRHRGHHVAGLLGTGAAHPGRGDTPEGGSPASPISPDLLPPCRLISANRWLGRQRTAATTGGRPPCGGREGRSATRPPPSQPPSGRASPGRGRPRSWRRRSAGG